MPFRSRDSLAAWLVEFETLGYPAGLLARVIEQDGSDGANTGLVTARLSSGLDAYIQPRAQDSTNWIVTIEAREQATELTAGEVTRLSSELSTVAALCAFLEEKALGVAEG